MHRKRGRGCLGYSRRDDQQRARWVDELLAARGVQFHDWPNLDDGLLNPDYAVVDLSAADSRAA